MVSFGLVSIGFTVWSWMAGYDGIGWYWMAGHDGFMVWFHGPMAGHDADEVCEFLPQVRSCVQMDTDSRTKSGRLRGRSRNV